MNDDLIPLELDRPHDECGVFGIYAPGRDVARLTFFGLFALQHRGQESAGIAAFGQDGPRGVPARGRGLRVGKRRIL